MDTVHVLDHAKPHQRYFEEISRIPRDSHQEKAVSDYIVAFAKEHGLWHHQDGLWNVIVKKPAASGYEGAPPVMLQGHMDMVCVKSPDSNHDFSRDPLDLYVEGGVLRARGTTLGADDGVGVAYMLAVLADGSLRNPALECVFTSQEETGLGGAEAIDESLLSARRMIGLDDCGEATTSVACFCSDRIEISRGVPMEVVSGEVCSFRISRANIVGMGGSVHQESGNAIKMAARLLHSLIRAGIGIRLCAYRGGTAENHTPYECDAAFACGAGALDQVKALLEQEMQQIREELGKGAESVRLDFTDGFQAAGMATAEASRQIVSLVYLLPGNVFQRDPETGEMTAVNNIGLIRLDADGLYVLMSTRCRAESAKAELLSRCTLLANAFSASAQSSIRYRSWKYLPESLMRGAANRVLVREGRKPMAESVCPGGLEMAVFARKLPGLDAVMIGSDYEDLHTTNEWLNLESFDRVYAFLVSLLAELKE